MKVAARHDIAGFRENHRVVGGAVSLDGDGFSDEPERFAGRAVHLRRAPHRVGVLDLAAELVRLVDAAAVHQALDVGRRDLLSAEGAGRVDAAFERVNGAAQGVNRKSRRDVGRSRELFGRRKRQRENGGRRLRPVDQREALLGTEDDRLQAGAL